MSLLRLSRSRVGRSARRRERPHSNERARRPDRDLCACRSTGGCWGRCLPRENVRPLPLVDLSEEVELATGDSIQSRSRREAQVEAERSRANAIYERVLTLARRAVRPVGLVGGAGSVEETAIFRHFSEKLRVFSRRCAPVNHAASICSLPPRRMRQTHCRNISLWSPSLPASSNGNVH